MSMGIDGNQWYCSNGLCIGDQRSFYVFADTLRMAIDGYNHKRPIHQLSTRGHEAYQDLTVAEYKGVAKSAGSRSECSTQR